MISKLKVNIVLITTNKLLNHIDIKKYNSQYNNLSVYFNNTFHDRYIIIDEKIVYHLGASLNHAGSKTFSINILNDIDIINLLIKNVKKCVKNLPKV